MDPHPRPPRHITGVAGLLRALRNLGLVGHAADDTRLQHFSADDGQPIPVRVLGDGAEGAPVVLVHGLGCSHRHWMPVGKRLGQRHRVFAWDARGHGSCRPHPGSAITLARLARDLRQLLDHFALERAVLVGHSMGALTVLQYLLDHGTDRVASVALVDQSPRIVTDEHWRLGMFGGCSAPMLMGLIAGARRDLAETVVHEVEAAAGGWLQRRLAPDAMLGRLLRAWLHKLDPSALLDLAESLATADLRAVLPTLDVPLWVVLGGRSAHYAGVPLEGYYRRTVPHAAVTVYDRSGHSPHVAEPGRFAQELMRFLEDHH
jgi:non-heme chloroperoxidase